MRKRFQSNVLTYDFDGKPTRGTVGLRSGDRSDDKAIRRNHESAAKIIEALDVKIDWWPS